MIEFNGKQYVLRYSQQRIEMIESTTNAPILANLAKNNNMLSLSDLKTYFAYGLKENGEDIFVPIKKALEVAQQLVESLGYASLLQAVLEALERDCPFLCQTP